MCTGKYANKCQMVQNICQTSMGSGLQVGQTEEENCACPECQASASGKIGQQSKHVFIRCFKRNDACMHKLTVSFGPWKTFGPALGSPCAFPATASNFLETRSEQWLVIECPRTLERAPQKLPAAHESTSVAVFGLGI